MDQEKIGKLIKKLRIENNLTQKELADKLSVTYQAVSKWENGKNIPDIAIIKQISQIFNLDINSILDGDTNKKNNKFKMIMFSFFIVLSILLIIITFYNRNDNYNFKTISANCNDFKIFGSIAYNKGKSTIHISKIEYCNNKNSNLYQSIESVLYESLVDVDKKISVIKDNNNDLNMTLEDYLQGIDFYIDNYSCKDIANSEIYLQINAKDYNNSITTYKIPLKFEKKC